MSRYIDAEKLKSILHPMEWWTPDERWVPEHEIANMLDFFPAADVQEVRHGRWINCGWSIKCSICDYDMPFSVRNYCPNCGSRMDLDGDTE